MLFKLSTSRRKKSVYRLITVAAVLLSLLSVPGRLYGVRALADGGNSGQTIKLAGGILTLPSTTGWIGRWMIGGTLVNVTASTKIEGQPVIGAFVEAEATVQSDRTLTATKIEIKLMPTISDTVKFSGRIEELPSTPGRVGSWKVLTRTVTVNDLTRIDTKLGEVAVGALAAVTAKIGENSSLTATEITILPGIDNGPAPLKITGKVEKLPSPIRPGEWPGEWVVSGRTVVVNEQTTIDQEQGTVMLGALVEVTGSIGLESRIFISKFNATRITVKQTPPLPPLPVTLRGKVEALPSNSEFIGDWTVGGRTIRASAQTKILGDKTQLAINSLVEVRGTADLTGVIIATTISLLRSESVGGEVSFVGEIRSIEPTATSNTEPNLVGTWKVGERTVQVMATTKIDQSNGPAQVGAMAEVEGALQADGSLIAREIEIRRGSGSPVSYARFFGTVETLPTGGSLVGTWAVSGRQVTVGTRTRIVRENGSPAVGAYVQVEGSQRTDGSVDAVSIQVERDKDAPAGSIGFINFYGSVVTLPNAVDGKYPGEWTIGQNNRKVNVDTVTKIDTRRGELKVGSFVEVKGYLFTDNAVRAISISVRPAPPAGTVVSSLSLIEFIGRVSGLPETANFVGQWTFDDGRKVNVSRRTVIDRQRSRIEIGALAEVLGAELPNGEIDARMIEVEAGQSSTASAFMQFEPVASVNAASYTAGSSSSSIIAAFGSNLARTTEVANTQPLPATLGGVTVLVDGRPAGLFFVSPSQINYQAPDELLPGTARVSVLRDGQPVAQGTLEISTAVPSIFTADSSGQGTPAGQLLRVRSNGQLAYEPLVRIENGTWRSLPVPIERRVGEQLYLILYGTGLNDLEDLDGNAQNGVAELVEVISGKESLPVLYAGRAPGFSGLDQLNLALPEGLTGNAILTIRVRDGEGNVLRANEVTIVIR